MTTTGSRPVSRVFAGHALAGMIFGLLMGFAYFIIEPFLGFSGRWEYLGMSLPGLLEIYLLFGVITGFVAGLIFGIFSSLLRRFDNPDLYVPFYAAGAIFAVVVLYTIRNYSMSRLRSTPMSMQGVMFIALLVVLLFAAFIFARSLRKRNLFSRIGGRLGAGIAVGGIILFAAAHFAAGRAESHLPAEKAAAAGLDGPNVVMIVLDALRADHLSIYGYGRETSPNIDRLAREGVMFSNAHSQGNRTIIAMPALFTSLYPSFHGAIGRGKLMRPLPHDHTTIAEMFSSKGYTTVGLMNNVYLKTKFNLTQGFDRLEEFYAERYNLGLYKFLRHSGIIERPRFAVNVHPDADEVTDVALQWLDRLEDRPFFMYVHYMDTHHPYAPPPPYDTLYGKTGDVPTPMGLFKTTTQLLRSDRLDELKDIELEKLVDYYDGTIRIADDEIGRLIERVVVASGDRETIVVITADHGDEFMEHGSLYHNNLVIEELIHVPLIFWSSKSFQRGNRVDCLVRHVDVLPTLGDLAGADIPAEAEGRSLVPLLDGEITSIEVESISEGDFCTALSVGNWKIMRVDTTDSFLLFDIDETPRETRDLSKTHPDEYERMHARLFEYLKKAKELRKAMEAEADEDTIRALKALGYI